MSGRHNNAHIMHYFQCKLHQVLTVILAATMVNTRKVTLMVWPDDPLADIYVIIFIKHALRTGFPEKIEKYKI